MCAHGCWDVEWFGLDVSIASSITFVPREALARVVELARRRVPELLPAHHQVYTTSPLILQPQVFVPSNTAVYAQLCTKLIHIYNHGRLLAMCNSVYS